MQGDLEMCGSIHLQGFEMLKVLGQGTFGTVALARSTTPEGDEVCAIKMLSKDFIIKNKLVDSVKSERAVLEKVDHDSIVKMHFAFQTSRMVYFVMEYCCGGELFFHLRQKSRDFWRRAPTIRFYAAEIIRALEYLHDDLDVAESGRPGRAELLAKKGRIVGGVGCPPNCRTSGKRRGSSGKFRPSRAF